mmetsp:Transcript_3444/g.3471  ORF Transcript_3444/g.3471 Transcript_3444/m.3471 type:complete len:97 (+) Transcript_3444:411-701(+)
MAIIFSSDKQQGDFTTVPRAVIAHDIPLIRNINYSHIQEDVAFRIAAAGNYVNLMQMLLELGATQNTRLERMCSTCQEIVVKLKCHKLCGLFHRVI